MAYTNRNLYPVKIPMCVRILMMIRSGTYYIGDAFAKHSWALDEESAFICDKSVFHPLDVTQADVRYAIFKEKAFWKGWMWSQLDDSMDQPIKDDEGIPVLGWHEVEDIYLPSALPSGNLPEDKLWRNLNLEEILEFCKRKKLEATVQFRHDHAGAIASPAVSPIAFPLDGHQDAHPGPPTDQVLMRGRAIGVEGGEEEEEGDGAELGGNEALGQ